jgi:DNA replicative helicase MCM subunit Mcm2 (Cdc46/Mcm family)
MNLTRSYQLQIQPNFHKLEDIRYTSNRYMLYLQHFITQLYYEPIKRFFSTKGTCLLVNQAQSRVNRDTFICVKCGYRIHADTNASVNTALKGQEKVNKYCSLDKAPVKLSLVGGR